MANQLFEEPFIGKYDGVSPVALLPKGTVTDGLNMRKVGLTGGWKPRKGFTLHTATQMAAATVLSLHQYRNPLQDETFLLAQCDSDLKYNTTVQPPTAALLGTDLITGVSSTVPGFSCSVGEFFCYADGTKGPVIWGGTKPRPLGFLFWDNGEESYLNYTREVTDNRADTEARLSFGAATATADVAYLFTNEIITGFNVTIGATVNAVSSTMTVSAWRGGAWVDVSATDGTDTAGVTLSKTGSVTWSAGADKMRMLGGFLGYAYKIAFSAVLTDATGIKTLTVTQAATTITNKWNGLYEWVNGCRFFNGTEYIESIGKITNEATSLYIDLSEATTSCFIYIKTIEPACTFGFNLAQEYENDAAATLTLEYWSGGAWTSLTATSVDETLTGSATLAKTGLLYINNADQITPIMRTMEGDSVPGYWYRVGFSATLATDVRLYAMVYAPFPKALPTYDGCVEFKGRLALWGDPEFPNYLRISAQDRPDCFSGSDSAFVGPFGDMSKILCAVPFYNELLVFKRDMVFMLEGYSPGTYGILKVTDTVGCASPHTVQVVEVGTPGLVREEGLTIALWQTTDGVYALDGRKPKKVSNPISQFFNPEDSTCIAAASIRNRQAFVDKTNNEYHFLLPTGELVYNYATDEWYPPWQRSMHLSCGISLVGNDNRVYVYGGTLETGDEGEDGFILRLENDTTDKVAAGTDVAISHSLKTRALPFWEKEYLSLLVTLRKVWAKFKAQSAGTVTVKLFKNLASTGVEIATPGAMSMVSSGEGIATPKLDVSSTGCSCFQLEFSLATVDQEMVIWGIVYELEMSRLYDS